MTELLHLIPMLCPQCQTAIPAQPDEVAWVCPQCGQGLLFSEAGLKPAAIQYFNPIPSGQKGRPFWVGSGQVAIKTRTAYSGRVTEDVTFWQHPRPFYIPAYSLPLEQLLAEGTRLVNAPFTLLPGPAVPFLPITLAKQDAVTFAEFIVLSIEANRKDKLKNIHFDLKLSSLQLWILP